MASIAIPSARSRGWGVAWLVVLTVVAYLPTLRNGFVWNDDTFLTQNRLIQSGDGLRQFWLTARATDYWPVTSTIFWLEWRLWGMHAAGYHAVNLSLHVAEALLLWAILRRLRVPGAYLGALLFALHPVNVESVAWITQGKNLMAMLFYLGSVYFFVRAEELGSGALARLGEPGPSLTINRWYVLSLFAFALAMLSKGSVAILPLVLIGIIAAWKRRVAVGDLLRLAPFFAVAAALTLVDIRFQDRQLSAAPVAWAARFLERALGAGAVVWFYLSKALLPINLSFVYPLWHIRVGNVLWWIPLLAAVGVTGWLWRRGRPRPWGPGAAPSAGGGIWQPVLFAWGYFCVALIPVMGFTDIYFMKFSLVADHYQHLALIGVTTLAGVGWSRWRDRTRAADVAAAAVLGLFLVLTFRQSASYRDSQTLFEATLQRNADSWLAHADLGNEFMQKGDIAQGVAQLAEAARLQPDDAIVQSDLGVALMRQGREAEAIAHFEDALWLDPKSAQAHNDLGNALAQMGRIPEAIRHYEAALQLEPADADAHFNLGNILVRVGRLPEAVAQFEAVLRVKPNSIEALNNLGTACLRLGHPEEAIARYEAALRIDPQYANARMNLAAARQALAARSSPSGP